MMRYWFIISLFFFPLTNLTSQILSEGVKKPPIDTSVLGSWPELASPLISNDGNYVAYKINNQPIGSGTLIIQSADKSWRKEFVGMSEASFTNNSKEIVFKNSDSLFILSLGADLLTTIPEVASYKFPHFGTNKWLAYQKSNSTRDLILLNPADGKEVRYSFVLDYEFNSTGNTLLILKGDDKIGGLGISLELITLPDCNGITIWSGDRFSNSKQTVKNYNFDNEGHQLAFIINEKHENKDINTIWYYRNGMDSAVVLVNSRMPGIGNDLLIHNSSPKFSKNGSWIFFELREYEKQDSLKADIVKVDLWSYKDIVLQTEQLKKSNSKVIAAVSTVEADKIVQVGEKGESVWTEPGDVNGDYVVISGNNNLSDFWWNHSPNYYYLFSLKDASRQLIRKGRLSYIEMSFSPTGRYLVYYDFGTRKYFSYDIKLKQTYEITKDISARLDNEYLSTVATSSAPVGIAGWLENDADILIYDNYDIWKVSPNAGHAPTNITNGYGNLHHIKLRLVDEKNAMLGLKLPSSILLTGFNVKNKYNGFYQKNITKKGDPELLNMGPYTFFHKDSQLPDTYLEVNSMAPIKARDANSWIVERMSAEEAPNYLFTRNFKDYTQLSNFQPQSKYNWLKTELITWNQFDGKPCQGVLYKPEDFDPHKKYPIIFWFYEKASYRMYEYLKPVFFDGDINIPLLVSRGYLVFTPDIQFSIASKSGRTNWDNCYNSIVSAAHYLSKKSWVNSKKMAIQGHSFAGGQVNHLITRTSIFAAAAEAAGPSDLVSSYLSLGGRLGSTAGERQNVTEATQGRMGANFWQRPDLYMKSSAVLNADKISTPLLIMHNIADPSVPWGQGMEMYLALRRLNKRVWLLQYDKGNHYVFGRDATDYTTRLIQFFNHYLKDAPPPKWMTIGIPASKRGIDSGLEFDFTGSCGNKCSTCEKRALMSVKK